MHRWLWWCNISMARHGMAMLGVQVVEEWHRDSGAWSGCCQMGEMTKGFMGHQGGAVVLFQVCK